LRESVRPIPARCEPVADRPPPGRVPGPAGGPDAGPRAFLRPEGLHDLRSAPAPLALRYPPSDLVVVAGLPGSGKSTLMRRCARARVIDSQHTRQLFDGRLPGLPYALYRPLVRLLHYRRLSRALAGGGPLVVHDCGTLPWVRHWLARTAARQGRRLHLILLDATPVEAVEGQRARGRRVSAYAFARHRRATAALRDRLTAGGLPLTGLASAVLLDRPGALDVQDIEFGDPL